MLKVNERTVEAVAALLYNNIYDLASQKEGAWCVEERRDDRNYLAFAKSLLYIVRAIPDAPDLTIIERAIARTNHHWMSVPGWTTIVIDQEYAYLPDEAAKFLPELRQFILDPYANSLILLFEGAFLKLDEDSDEATKNQTEL
ncbi:hypothetical protein EPA93_19125 [Ktedonosporobacter rubrisoli]|uniref:Uncharacterized protein n=1 Tax=Ktedonosporobacter rubrisoli TaxID=2509675 RepID=A0A4P6JS10_KTERU|nr:hypothetical protein [Ktedonosporobacter rubrisoli]QBD77992.1 hypothetical protein EPA93_19125 [Ktedonosporobacter rubrisoli]